MLRDAVFIFLALLCEILGTVGGFGSSVFFVPVAQFFYSFNIVLGVTAVLHVFSNTSKLLFFGKHVNYRLLFFYGIPSIAFVVLGAYLTTIVSIKWVQLTLGIFLVLFSTAMLLFPKIKISPSNTNAISSGALAGFVAGFNGTGGAIRGLSMAAFKLEKNVFVATSAAIDFGVDLSRSIIYIDHNYFTKDLLYLIPFLIGISLLGAYLGKKILTRINQVSFRKIVLVLILIMGIVVLMQELNKLLYS